MGVDVRCSESNDESDQKVLKVDAFTGHGRLPQVLGQKGRCSVFRFGTGTLTEPKEIVRKSQTDGGLKRAELQIMRGKTGFLGTS